jgi:hypothetical protein
VHLRNRRDLSTKSPPVALEPAFFIRFVVEIEASYFGPAVIFERNHELLTPVSGRRQTLGENEISPDDESGLPKFLTQDKSVCPVGAGGELFDKHNPAEARRELQRKQLSSRAQGADPRLAGIRNAGVNVNDAGAR